MLALLQLWIFHFGCETDGGEKEEEEECEIEFGSHFWRCEWGIGLGFGGLCIYGGILEAIVRD